MPKLLFLDTETTGNDPIKDRLIQLCYKTEDLLFNEYFKPPFPIPVKAQSISHITNKMVDNKPSFSESEAKKALQSLLDTHILVAHNALFDILILKNEGLETKSFIDTLRVARHLDSEAKIPEYNLQYLRYLLELDVEANAHDAHGDVLVLEALFNRLHQKLIEQNPTLLETHQMMIELSQKPVLIKKINFGKYKGQNIEDIAKLDKNYLLWLLNEKLLKNDPNDEDWIHTLKHYTNS